MKKTIKLFFATLLLFVGSSFTTAPAFSESKAALGKNVASARVHANVGLTVVNVSNIEAQLPVMAYSLYNGPTSTYGTVVDLYNYDLEVQGGDILYFKSDLLPLILGYTITAAEVASGKITVVASIP
ncbi:hypothetical protein [Paraflavitalea speifideaquila]|uniref:hypothetical protein n=1 Tax=Paraflavitalea speifideaquila TaxID=3076558 RepID=UPI0028F0736B|nr:hypothetical protein [Paraflavitalea speifideiaquila]